MAKPPEKKTKHDKRTKSKTPEELKKYWARRHTDPMFRAKWNAQIEVTPADSAKGKVMGQRRFPDGSVEDFVNDRRVH